MNFCKVTGEKPSIGAKEERYPDFKSDRIKLHIVTHDKNLSKSFRPKRSEVEKSQRVKNKKG